MAAMAACTAGATSNSSEMGGGGEDPADEWHISYSRRWVAGARIRQTGGIYLILADGWQERGSGRRVAYILFSQMGCGSEDARRWASYALSPQMVAGARMLADCRHICLFSQMATWDVELAPGRDGGAAPKPPEQLGPRPQLRSLGEGDLVLSPTEPLRLKGRDDRAC